VEDSKLDTITAIRVVRDSLRTNLADPYIYAGGTSRTGDTWIFADEPRVGPKYPQIQIKKLDNPSTILSIGPDYGEREFLYLNVWFYTKNGWKAIMDGETYANSQFVEKYQGLIKTTLKAQFNNLYADGVNGYAHLNTTTVGYDVETQLYYGAVTIRVEYFQGCGA